MLAKVSMSGNVALIRMTGEFDFSAQEMLGEAFSEAVNSPADVVQVDMEKTAFIDSSVLRMLLKLHDDVLKSNKTLQLVNCHDKLREIFEIGGFDRIFAIQYTG